MFAEGLTLGRKVGFCIESLPSSMTLPRDVHGAPLQSLIVKVSEVVGSFKTLRKIALFWCRLIAEVSHLHNSIVAFADASVLSPHPQNLK